MEGEVDTHVVAEVDVEDRAVAFPNVAVVMGRAVDPGTVVSEVACVEVHPIKV